MKLQVSVSRTKAIKGRITRSELLASVRESFAIPSNARARFYVQNDTQSMIISSQQFMGAPATSDVTDSSPLHFSVEWEIEEG